MRMNKIIEFEIKEVDDKVYDIYANGKHIAMSACYYGTNLFRKAIHMKGDNGKYRIVQIKPTKKFRGVFTVNNDYYCNLYFYYGGGYKLARTGVLLVGNVDYELFNKITGINVKKWRNLDELEKRTVYFKLEKVK